MLRMVWGLVEVMGLVVARVARNKNADCRVHKQRAVSGASVAQAATARGVMHRAGTKILCRRFVSTTAHDASHK